MPPGPTRYAKSGDYHLAYSATGEGDLDVLYVPTWLSQLEHLWESPKVRRFFERSAHLGRLIMFDRRGSGMSDPIVGAPTLEEQMDDVVAVLDAVGSGEAAVFAQLEAGAMATLFAATHPERTSGLILFESMPRMTKADDYDWPPSMEEREQWIESLSETWGSGERVVSLSRGAAEDPRFRAWAGRLERLATSPGTAKAFY